MRVALLCCEEVGHLEPSVEEVDDGLAQQMCALTSGPKRAVSHASFAADRLPLQLGAKDVLRPGYDLAKLRR